MPPKERTAKERRDTMARDKAKRRKPAGPRVPRHEAYARHKRVQVRAELRQVGS